MASLVHLARLVREFIRPIVSLLLSIGCFLSLIGVFWSYHGKEAPPQITLNAIVALLLTLTKLSLMVTVGESISQLKWTWFAQAGLGRSLFEFEVYDGCSRGEIGSFSFIFSWRKKRLVRPHCSSHTSPIESSLAAWPTSEHSLL